MIYIKIEEVIGNAFINYFEKTGKRVLTFCKINKYAEKIEAEFNKNGTKAIFYPIRDDIDAFFEKYSKWFQKIDNGIEILVVMNNYVTLDELSKHFWSYLPLDVTKIFINPENVKALLE